LCDYTKHSACLDKVMAQLEHHFACVRELPLHCNRHNASHGLQVLNDVFVIVQLISSLMEKPTGVSIYDSETGLTSLGKNHSQC